MTPHRLIVSRGFRIAGLVIGVPSCLAALGFGVGAFIAAGGPAPSHSPPLSVSTYGLVGLLANAAQGVGAALSGLNMLAAGIFGLLAVLGLVGTLFGVLLYGVGRGLKASAGWARVLASIIAGVAALIAALAFLASTGAARAVDAAVLAALGYVMWVLIARFGDQPLALGEPGPP